MKTTTTALFLFLTATASNDVLAFRPQGVAQRLESDIGDVFIYTRTSDYDKSVAAVICKL